MDLEPLIKTAGELVAFAAKCADTYVSIKKRFPKKPGSKRDLTKLGEEIDGLQKNIQQLAELLVTLTKINHQTVLDLHKCFDHYRESIDHHSKLVDAAGGVVEILKKMAHDISSYDKRLKVVEASMQSGKKISKV